MLPEPSHRDLPEWREAIALATDVHRFGGRLPEDPPVLGPETRAATTRVPTAIALALAGEDRDEVAAALAAALGALARLDTLLLLAGRLGFAGGDDLDPLHRRIDELRALLDERLGRLNGPFGLEW